MASAPVSETSNKTNVAARYAFSNLFGGATVLMVLAGLPPEKAQSVMTNLHVMYADTQGFIGAFANIWYVVFPIASVWLARIGINSSGFGAMVEKVLAAAKAGDLEAQKTIISAAAAPELGTRAIINPVLAPDPSTPSTVVASAQDLPPTPASTPLASPLPINR